MFNSTVIDVAVGLIFIFLAVSLAVSATVETLASVLNWRANSLRQGLQDLLNDPHFDGLALQIYNHALVNPFAPGTATTAANLKQAPSYIDAAQFAAALFDELTKTADGAPRQIDAAIGAVTDPQLRQLLKGISHRAGGDALQIRKALATWFDNGMDRLSGSYKRKTQFWSFVVALVIVVACNVSTVDVARALWQQPVLAHTMAPSPTMDLKDALTKITLVELPVGWTADRWRALPSAAGLAMVAGWLLTALATLFGAPFWFDALQQFVRLKGSGPSPQEKQNGTGAAA